MTQPLLKFGQPQVKYIEIDESIVPIPQNLESPEGILAFIDQEWGELNTPIRINSTQDFYDNFGEIPSIFTSPKGSDYLPQTLQQKLQGQVPMYVIRVGNPQDGFALSDYKEFTEYGLPDSQFLTIGQKHQGLFGKDLSIIISKDRISGQYILSVAKCLKFNDQTSGLNSEFSYLETFISEEPEDTSTQRTAQFAQLVTLVNENSHYITLEYVIDAVDYIVNTLETPDVLKIEFVTQLDASTARAKITNKLDYDDVSVITVEEYNQQDSLICDFGSEQQLTAISNSQDFTDTNGFLFKLIPTLGISEHSSIQQASGQYTTFLNFILLDIQIPRKNTVVIQDTINSFDITEQIESLDGTPFDYKASFMQAYYPWIVAQIDGREQFVPPSYFITNKILTLDQNQPIQGLKYGVIRGRPQRFITEEERDTLSLANINSIVYFPVNELTMQYDEKTRYMANSQLSRLSQRLISIDIEEQVSKQLRPYLFEPLVQNTFDSIRATVDGILLKFKNRGFIYDYRNILDTSQELLDNNMVIITVKFKPMKFLEFVELNFTVRSYQQGV